MTLESYPLEKIRAKFPALKRLHNEKTIGYFDGPGGSQVVQECIDAISFAMSNGTSNLAGLFPTSYEVENVVKKAREAMGDLLDFDAGEIAFGQNMTSLAYAIAHALSRDWTNKDEIVVTELDHRANVDPWRQVAENKGTKVNWIKLDIDKFTLKLDNLNEIINERTKLVAIGHASNGVGTINDVSRIAKRAHEVGAIVIVDAVHSTPHLLISKDLGADIILCSSYKFFGPHVGIAAIKHDLFQKLETYRLICAPSYVPGKLETGTQGLESIAGIPAVIDFIASFGTGDTRREKIVSGFEVMEGHENYLANKIRDVLSKMDKVIIYQSNGPKTPTVAFNIEGKTPQEVTRYLCDNYSIFAGAGHFYAQTLSDLLGIDGWIRVGMAPYVTEEEVDRFLQGIKDLTS